MDSPLPYKKTKLGPLPAAATNLSPPIAVLDDDYYDDDDSMEEVEVYVASVVNKSYISELIHQLKTELPMPVHLAHLKRVRDDEILLRTVESCEERVCVDAVKKLQGVRSFVSVRRVSAKSPKTKRQHGRANQLWPCNFHPRTEIENLLARTFFLSDQVSKQYEYMRLALNVAQKHRALVGVVVVDPTNERVVATAHDQRDLNPSNHAVMMALEKVAAVQRKLHSTERDKKVDNDPLPYLCTGYDFYVTREPCTMCAMGMVHSRVRRVFYGYESELGALGSKCKVHTKTALNHHYLVFRDILSNECRKLEKYASDEIF